MTGRLADCFKELQLWPFADRTSAAKMRANQLRLYCSACAAIRMTILRRAGLQETALANARGATIRSRLIKLAGRIKVSVRRVRISFSSVYPLQELFAQPRCASHSDSARRTDHELTAAGPVPGEVCPKRAAISSCDH